MNHTECHFRSAPLMKLLRRGGIIQCSWWWNPHCGRRNNASVVEEHLLISYLREGTHYTQMWNGGPNLIQGFCTSFLSLYKRNERSTTYPRLRSRLQLTTTSPTWCWSNSKVCFREKLSGGSSWVFFVVGVAPPDTDSWPCLFWVSLNLSFFFTYGPHSSIIFLSKFKTKTVLGKL